MLFQEDSHANLSPQQAEEKEKLMTVISGLKCLELSERLNRPLLLAKTLLACSQWKMAKHLTRYALTWKMKATKSNYLLFRLAVLELGTDEIGCGLLLTPATVQIAETPEHYRSRMDKAGYKNGNSWNSLLSQIKFGQDKFFPTPQASDNRDRGNISNPSIQKRMLKGKQIMLSQSVNENSGQLNPNWVEWLMGYPIGWTDLKD